MDISPNSLLFLFFWAGGFAALWFIGFRFNKRLFSISTSIPAFLLCVSLHILYLSLQFESSPGDTSAGTIPSAMAALLCVLALLQLTLDVRQLPSCKDKRTARSSPVRLFVILIIIAVYLVLIPHLGFYCASGLFLLSSFVLLGARSVPRMIVVSTLWGLIVFFLFSSVLKVPLPEGVLF